MTSRFLLLAVLCPSALLAQPTITNITPAPAGTSAGHTVSVTITGTGFTTDGKTMVAADDDSGVTVGSVSVASATSLTAHFKLAKDVKDTAAITVTTGAGTSSSVSWATGVAENQCLESVGGECLFRWEVDATGLSNSTSQTSTATAPNVLVKLDWQIASPKNTQNATLMLKRNQTVMPTAPGATAFADRYNMHLIFRTGFTQINTATKLQPTSSNTSATTTSSTTPACTGTAPATGSSATTCMAAAPQQAFIAEAGTKGGFTFLEDGVGRFLELGFAARGSLQSIIQTNQITTSGGLSYASLTSLNPKTAVGTYEGVGRFRIGEHDTPASTSTGKYSNTSSLLELEVGAQYNSGMSQLAGNPLTNTKPRVVGRFYAYPEISGTNHTKMLIGLEYSGGINGGPKVIQVVWGTNINPARLWNPSKAQN